MVMDALERLVPPRRLGKYLLLARLGEGGMASVYVASVGEGALRRLAAVKLLRLEAGDHDFVTRFLDEAKVVVRLHHNNLVDVREASEVDGQPYIAMELIEGRDLADIWDRCAEVSRAFPVALAVHIVREILRGLHYAHTFPGLSLVHRDVSPSNILVDWAGAVRLADFGLATSSMRAAHTVPGMVFGKVGYMAPEQARAGTLDARADVYACGVVLWELLTGRPLRDTGIETQQVAGWHADPASRYSSRVDPELDAIVVRALERDRDARWSSAVEFLEALSGWMVKRAPDTTQETLERFMATLFGDARRRDHRRYTEILESARPTEGSGAKTVREEVATPGKAGPPAGAQGAGEAAPARRSGPRPTSEEIGEGTLVATRYRVQGPIGKGGMGTVYLAEHVTVGRKVAVKVLTHEWSQHPTVAQRFREEARAASAAGHQNIVEVFDAGELPDGRLYLVMELLDGRSLHEELDERGPLDPARACRIIRQVARAVRAAHGVGIIHRDLKPDNVMLVDRGEGESVKVLDFGISASADRPVEEERLTAPGYALGTPEYMAPEQAMGRPPTERFDIYAMGVILYEMLTGKPPFVSTNVVEVLTRKATEAAPRVDEIRPGLPAGLVTLVHACIDKKPEHRPANADVFLAMLDPSLDELEGPALRSGAVQAGGVVVSPRSLRASTMLPDKARSRRGAWFAAASVIGLILAGGLTWAMWPRPSASGGPSPEDPRVAANAAPAAVGERAPSVAERTTAEPVPTADPPVPTDPQSPGASAEAPLPSTHADAPAQPVPTTIDDDPTVPNDGVDDDDDEDGDARSGAGSSRPRPSADSPECADHRETAEAAFGRHDWPAALRSLKVRSCWKGHRNRFDEIRTRSLFETQELGACIRAGIRSKNTAARKYAETCKARQERGG